MTHTKADKSNIQKIFIPVLALTILLVMVAWLAGVFDEKVSPTINNEKNSSTIDRHSTYTLVPKNIPFFEPVSASIVAKQATIISSRVLARIEHITVRSSDMVKKGDLLVQLEQSDLQSQMLQAQQNINAMQARFKEAQQNLERSIKLFKEKLISEFELDKNRAIYHTLQAELTATKQALAQAKTTLSYAQLIAPISGRIVDRFAEPGDTAQPGVKLLSLYNPLSLRVEAQVREQLALTLINGQTIEVELPNINRTIIGKIEEIVPAANTASRSFLVKVHIDYHESLLPGMYARVLIPAGNKTALTIPTNSISHVGQLDFVWLNIDGEAQRRFVRLGKEKSGMVTVVSGLTSGDEIIIN